jgi:hypothetical protein
LKRAFHKQQPLQPLTRKAQKEGLKIMTQKKSFSLAHLAALSAKWDMAVLFYGTTL